MTPTANNDDSAGFSGPDRALLEGLLSRYPFGAIVMFDEELRYTHVSGRGLAEVGLDPDAMVGKPLDELFPPETVALLEEPYRAALEGEESTVEVPFAGHTYIVWIAPLPEPARGGMAVTFDVSERTRAETDLRLIRSAVAALDIGVCIADAGGDQPLIFVNEGFTRITGYTRKDALGRNCRFLQGPETDPAAVEEMSRAIDAGEPVQVTLLNQRKDGAPFWNRVTISPITNAAGVVTHFVGVLEDVTHHRELGKQLEVRERLAAVGQLAGGVAHDIRNVLTGVGGILELALERDDVPADLRADLDEATTILERATSVAERLLVFSRGRSMNPEHVDLRAHLENSVDVYRKMLREHVRIGTELPGRPLWTFMDPGQLDQVILNLLKNAEDAIPSGGEVVVSAVLGDEATAPFEGDPAIDTDRDWVRITVADTGTGMDEATLERAMEPFFTTKSSHKGTGLGLSTVYGAIKQSGGHVAIDSTRGLGTEVHLLLPLTGDRPAAPDEQPETGPVRGRVLLAEDEAAVLRVATRALETDGHEVTDTGDGADAWTLFKDDPYRFDLVITDAVMPRMSGIELARRIRSVSDDIPIVIMTGYTDEELDGEVDWGDIHYLEKPFKLDRLRATVQQLLQQAHSER